MAIAPEIRLQKVKVFADSLKKEEVLFDYTDTNALRIFLSKSKAHYLDVDFFNREEFYSFQGRHDLNVAEITQLQKILLMINAEFSPDTKHT